MKKLMIGGQALVKLGSDRATNDTDYIVNDLSSEDAFSFDRENNIDYINANGNRFFAEIWKLEENNIGELASPRALLELKAYAFVQHCQNFNWSKADSTEYDMKFLVRTFGLGMESLAIVKRHVRDGEFSEIEKVIKSVRK